MAMHGDLALYYLEYRRVGRDHERPALHRQPCEAAAHAEPLGHLSGLVAKEWVVEVVTVGEGRLSIDPVTTSPIREAPTV